ncbi:hypothetical protein AM469_000052 [Pseudomonas aeruginosa]|nr:hypothetical protein AM469_000052 [Pseudomonas aeruginosa]
MPRQGRVVLPNYPLHMVQRGHSRQVVFAEDEDYQRIDGTSRMPLITSSMHFAEHKGDRFIFPTLIL